MSRVSRAATAGTLLSAAVGLWWARRRASTVAPSPLATPREDLLARAAMLLRLPTSPGRVPEVLPGAAGLRCPATGRRYPVREGILDLLPDSPTLTPTQRTLDTPLTALLYDRARAGAMRLFGAPTFPAEVAAIQSALGVRPGDAVLDLACGHGNFTVEWAKRAGPDGLVIGLDLSPAMLARAARRVGEWGLENVLLVRGDALNLPLADGGLDRINCSGGFHQFPDLPRALREIARVGAPGATLTASTFAEGPGDRHAALKRRLRRRFALHFVSLPRLGEQLAAVGFEGYRWSLRGDWFGYASATRAAQPRV